MKDYQKLSRAGLLAYILKLKSQHAALAKARRKSAATALSEREARLRAILETAVEGIITIDDHGIVESMNPAAEKIFGYPAAEVTGKNVSQLMASPHQRRHDGYIGNYLRTGQAKIIGLGRETEGKRKDGTIFPMELSVGEVRLPGRRLFTGFIRDITRRKETEKALAHLAAIVESSDDAIIGKTLEGCITSWNQGAEVIFGYTRKEVLGRHISILIPPERQGEEPVIIEKLKRGESVDHFETIRRRKDGRLIHVSATISPIREPDGRIIGASKVARDITGRKRLEREILEISDREQRRIGHDLHDGLCQHLAGIELMSEALEQRLAKHSKTDAARAGEIAKNMREAIGQTRSLARGLSPVMLESEGLMSALQELADNTRRLFKIKCRFDGDAHVLVPNHVTAAHLFRLAQEAVSNAIKHGRATDISLRLKSDPGRVYLGISDNGTGFPAEIPKSEGMGLRIMQYRAGIIGGSLTIEPSREGGTMVICSAPNLPLPPKRKANHGIKK